ncbi:colicin V family bacteriocin [Klebsiella quasivariicola]|uniref:colicin V family bacteriocin n=1 Tax=Klebsiella quasivariicola TaxID=2026240 RepID=UPI00247A749D|nr:colicin V family bacteriocin [Klebsiella quasivariicola]
MRELSLLDLKMAKGGYDRGETIAGAVGAAIGADIGGPVGGIIGTVVGSELYNSINEGWTMAPGVSQGVGSYNPNYNGSLVSPGYSSSWGGGMGRIDFKCRWW